MTRLQRRMLGANAARHARASAVLVRVGADRAAGDAIRPAVRDDRRGGADPACDPGMADLKDRVEAIGGALSMRSRPGEGMTLAEIRLENSQAMQRKRERDLQTMQYYSAELRKDGEWPK
jgi:signal transduction histidine kinase